MSKHICASQGEPLANERGEVSLAREEIVRCKDCEYMERQTTYDGSMSWFLCSHFKRPTRCDGFCAWGVRS